MLTSLANPAPPHPLTYTCRGGRRDTTMTQQEIQSLQGTEDLLPWQWGHWRNLYRAAREMFRRYGYGSLRTPVIEYTRLFEKGTGATTDIVQKEMYTIPTSDEEETICLRPEGTPPAIRAYLENGLHMTDPFQKFCYMGPMFRHERPQRGRLRQFHQIGVEAIGGASPSLDAETIALANDIFREVGLKQCTTYVNSLGCADDRAQFRDEIQDMLRQRVDALCADCHERLERNVLRVYDCKNEACQQVVSDLPTMLDYICEQCREHYEAVRGWLEHAGVPYLEDPRLARGLDYYTRTVYEIKHPGLGARDTICGGGRYDNLVELFGGPSMPCVGFGIGAEATLLAMESELGEPEGTAPRPQAYVVCFGDEARGPAFVLAQELRAEDLSVELDHEDRSPSSQMKVANRLNAPICLLLGGNELEAGEVTLKNMATGKQWQVPREETAAAVRKALLEE